MKQYLISENDLQECLRYLAGRPYSDVFILVNSLQQSTLYVEPTGTVAVKNPYDLTSEATSSAAISEATKE